MSEQISPYAEVLADLVRERDGLTSAINLIRRKMGLPPEEATAQPLGSAPPTTSNGSTEKPQVTEIKPDTFFGLKVPEAIRAYLAMTKRPARPAVITKALLDGGLQSTAKDFPALVQTSLARMRGEVVRVPNGWALAEWYPGRTFDKTKKGDKPTNESGPE
jgi:hypothetical protein